MNKIVYCNFMKFVVAEHILNVGCVLLVIRLIKVLVFYLYFKFCRMSNTTDAKLRVELKVHFQPYLGPRPSG